MKTLAWNLPSEVGGYPLPQGAQFSKQHQTLDPDIFTSTEVMRPEIREWALAKVNAFWQPRYGSWWEWANLYLAGSTASYWWSGDLDFDLLVGISSVKLHQAHPELPTEQQALCDHFNVELREGFNAEAVLVPGHHEPYSLTADCNPGSYDIRAIEPYAAYSISDDRWAVHPAKLPKTFSARSMPRSFWETVGAMADHIKAVLAEEEPERTEHATELLGQLHHGRQLAYSRAGTGVFDQRQVTWLYLERIGILQELIQAVHPEGKPHPVPLVP